MDPLLTFLFLFPAVDDVKKATELALAAGCDGVLALGGGSVIDLGKVPCLVTSQTGLPVDVPCVS